jgi:hypothetical protein
MHNVEFRQTDAEQMQQLLQCARKGHATQGRQTPEFQCPLHLTMASCTNAVVCLSVCAWRGPAHGCAAGWRVCVSVSLFAAGPHLAHELRHDAADAPHVNGRRVVRAPQQDLRRPVPQRHDLREGLVVK